MQTGKSTPEPLDRPWEELADLIESGPDSAIEEFVNLLPAEDVRLAVSRLDEDEQIQLMEALSPEAGARVLEEVPEIQSSEMFEHLAAATAAAILQELPSDERADLIGGMERANADAILDQLHPKEAEAVRELSSYQRTEAGGLMVTEYLAYRQDLTLREVVDDLREHHDDYKSYETQYLYALDSDRRLVGVIPLRNVLLARPSQVIQRTMIRNPLTISHHAGLEEIEEQFDHVSFLGLPVVDEAGVLLGVLTRRDLQDALSKRADSDFLKRQGMVEADIYGVAKRFWPLLRHAGAHIAGRPGAIPRQSTQPKRSTSLFLMESQNENYWRIPL